MANEKCNGWSNYPTWNCNLWLSEGDYEYIYTQFEETDFLERDRNMQIYNLATTIKDYIQMAIDDMDEPTGLFANMLGWAINQIDWYELAEANIDDAIEFLQREGLDYDLSECEKEN